jgi:hypothetical protein
VPQDKPDTSFRVIDRRLFTEEGELRPEAKERARQEKEAPPAGVSGPAATAGKAPEPPAPGPAPARSPYFDLLVRSLANQAAILMTGMTDPATGESVVDVDGAREVIDMLDALREKTRGNLAPEEDRLLSEMLGSLKLSYLELTKAVAGATGQRRSGAASRR